MEHEVLAGLRRIVVPPDEEERYGDGSDVRDPGQGAADAPDVIAQSIGFIGPVFASAFFIATIAGASFTGKGAGIAVPVSIILAAIGILGVAWIISRYARRIHAAGSLYDYVTEAFGRRAGFLAGWVYYGGMTALTLAIGLAFGGFLSSTLQRQGRHRHRVVLARDRLLDRRVLHAVHRRAGLDPRPARAGARIDADHRRLRDLHHPEGRRQRELGRPFDPGESTASGIFYGVLYAVIMFIGFETAANLAEETADPRRLDPARRADQRRRRRRSST